MAWNRPSTSQSLPADKAQRKNASLKGLIIFGVVVASVVIGCIILCPEKHVVQESQEVQPHWIGEVKHAAPKTNVVALSAQPKKERPQRVGEVRNGYRLLPSGRLHRVVGEITNSYHRTTLIEKTFKHESDWVLAGMMTIEPGEAMVGDSSFYFHGYTKGFREAIKEPILDEPGDDEYVKELKAGVRELREELKDRLAQGENIEQLLRDSREEMMQLSLYRQELEDQVRRIAADGLSQSDYDDLIGAANSMLAERGCKKLTMPTVAKHAILINHKKKEEKK